MLKRSAQTAFSERSMRRWPASAVLTPVDPRAHRARIVSELRRVGISQYGLMKAESHYLPRIIHPNEHIGGVVYGYCQDSFAMLVATDRRILFVDKKPFFIHEDEVTYDVVSGVEFGHVGLGATVTLHTRIKDYTIRTFNQHAALRFVEFIEERCLENEYL